MATIPAQNAQETPGVESTEQRFRRLTAIWEAETLVLSNPNLIANHWDLLDCGGSDDEAEDFD